MVKNQAKLSSPDGIKEDLMIEMRILVEIREECVR